MTKKGLANCLFMALLTLCNAPVWGQFSVTEADSISYDLYLKKDWRELARYGETAARRGFDFYYLHLRTGIALYECGRWHAAEAFFEKAAKMFPEEALAKEYLGWICLQTGREPEASRWFSELPVADQQRLNHRRANLFESLYLEAGQRRTSTPDTAGTFLYASVGLNHRFSPHLQVYQAYSFQKQDFFWGGFEQHQYYVAPTLSLDRGWKVALGGNIFRFKSRFDYAGTDEVYTDTVVTAMGNFTRKDVYNGFFGVGFDGDLELDALYVHLAVAKTWRGFHASVQFAPYFETTRLRYRQTVDSLTFTQSILNGNIVQADTLTGISKAVINSNSSAQQNQIGLSLGYTLRFNPTQSLTAGAEVQWVFRGTEQHTMVVPYFNMRISSRLGFSGFYLQKGAYPLCVFNGSLVLNNYDTYRHRLSLTARADIFRRLSVYLTGQWESLDDDFLAGSYTGSGAMVGLQLKL